MLAGMVLFKKFVKYSVSTRNVRLCSDRIIPPKMMSENHVFVEL